MASRLSSLTISVAVAGMFLVAGSGVARGDFLTPTGAWSGSFWPGPPVSSPAQLINGSGMTGNSATDTHWNNSLAEGMWVTGNTDGGLSGALGSPPPVAGQEVVFGLGGSATGWDLTGTTVRVEKRMVADPKRRIGSLEVVIHVPRELAAESRALLERAAMTCPVYASLRPEVEVPVRFRWGNGTD